MNLTAVLTNCTVTQRQLNANAVELPLINSYIHDAFITVCEAFVTVCEHVNVVDVACASRAGTFLRTTFYAF